MSLTLYLSKEKVSVSSTPAPLGQGRLPPNPSRRKVLQLTYSLSSPCREHRWERQRAEYPRGVAGQSGSPARPRLPERAKERRCETRQRLSSPWLLVSLGAAAEGSPPSSWTTAAAAIPQVPRQISSRGYRNIRSLALSLTSLALNYQATIHYRPSLITKITSFETGRTLVLNDPNGSPKCSYIFAGSPKASPPDNHYLPSLKNSKKLTYFQPWATPTACTYRKIWGDFICK